MSSTMNAPTMGNFDEQVLETINGIPVKQWLAERGFNTDPDAYDANGDLKPGYTHPGLPGEGQVQGS